MAADTQALLLELRALHGNAIDLSLDRMRRLTSGLGSPEKRLPPVVHVAGTNGKGSVVALLRAMLESAGRRVHALTSPPLRCVHETIRLADRPGRSRPIGDAALAELLDHVLATNDGRPLTSFEGETAAALLAFAATPADILLLETGLGGRLDATNVVEQPLLTILTPIGLDHVELLGSTLQSIAGEKAGILKRGVDCVVARQDAAAFGVIERRAAKISARLHVFGSDFDAYEQHGRLVYQDQDGLLDLPLPALAGRHQVENAGVAIAAALRLGPLTVGEEAIENGLTTLDWPARLQRLSHGGLARVLPAGSEIWLDGGHNSAAAAAMAQAMADREERVALPLVLVVGMLATKDPRSFLSPFRGLAAEVVAVPIADTSRAYAKALNPSRIAGDASLLGLSARTAASLEAALELAAKLVGGPVRVLVCGSFHLAGGVLALEETAARAN